MDHSRAEKYRDSAAMLRGLAARLGFDLQRRAALTSLADEFDRLADYVDGRAPMTADAGTGFLRRKLQTAFDRWERPQDRDLSPGSV